MAQVYVQVGVQEQERDGYTQITPVVRMEGVTGIQPLDELSRAGMSQGVKDKDSFQNILQNVIRKADDSVKTTEIMDEQLTSGQVNNLHTALIQAEQSAVVVEFTTQLASKAVSAYNQIMGMQVQKMIVGRVQ